MTDILITEFMDDAAVERLRGSYSVHYDPNLADNQDDIPALLGGVRALIVRNRTQVRGDILAAAGNLKCVGRLGVGLDNIDVDACEKRGATVYPATGANDDSVAEYVITTAMQLLRGAYMATQSVAQGAWPRQALIGRELGGRTLGLIGYGAIARQTARRARALGMTIIAYDPFVEKTSDARLMSLTDLLQQADVISLHVPLTADTKHLINAEALAQMRSDAVIINAARGGVIDEAALANALRTGAIGGAALDVFETEPLSAQAGVQFLGLANLILTPHIAGVTEESNVRVSSLIADKILAHLDR